ncbi:MAG: transporter permease [Acidimicrobiales bacterium]|nr:transporter permease [Acidimicrobiales bacterium]
MTTTMQSTSATAPKAWPRPIVESSPLHWVFRVIGVAVIAAVAIYVGLNATPSTLGNVTEACILAIAAVALNLLLGFNGQISIGHSTFVGLAAFAAGYTVNFWHWNAYWSLVLGIVLCFALGFALGMPALRLKGPYLALVTLAVAFVWPTVAKKFLAQKVKKNSLKGTHLSPPTWTGLVSKGKDARLDKAIFLYWCGIILLLVAYVVVRNLRKSRIGRSLVAVRDNETAAAVMGVNLKFTKTITFGVSAAIAGTAGWLSAARLDVFNDTSFTILNSIKYLLALFLGGAATLVGPIVGAFAYFFLDDYLRSHAPHWTWLPGQLSKGPIASFLLGAIVIAFVFIAPFGLVGFVKDQARRVFIVTPRPLRPALTPSVLDDERPEETKGE